MIQELSHTKCELNYVSNRVKTDEVRLFRNGYCFTEEEEEEKTEMKI